jgi:hypothetical protein
MSWKLSVSHCFADQRDALFIHFIKNQGLLHVSNIICSSSGGVTQTAFGIWQWNCNRATANWHYTNIPNAVCVAPLEDEQLMLETCTGPFILNKNKWKMHHVGFIVLVCETIALWMDWKGKTFLESDVIKHCLSSFGVFWKIKIQGLGYWVAFYTVHLTFIRSIMPRMEDCSYTFPPQNVVSFMTVSASRNDEDLRWSNRKVCLPNWQEDMLTADILELTAAHQN